MHNPIIQHMKRFADISESDVDTIASCLKPITVKKKGFLLKEGQVCKSAFFVQEGCLRLFFINEKGVEQITQFAIENWWVADYMSFGNQKPSPFYIQAVENTEVVALDYLAQENLLRELPQLERYFRVVLQKALAASQLRIKYLYGFSKEEGYQHFISHFPEFVQRIPQYMLASYLNFTPEYLSEMRKKQSQSLFPKPV
ncbi:Crp/Fnr family transcriptional regulator [Parasediminibacterium sp. JCM 36343]|uniref:Crp/Fnr family transcriptional regulator n=1 Tax=Parasediminibacterium sp. JCM 36343 TaxID=3374279 RepID=UPI00397947AF